MNNTLKDKLKNIRNKIDKYVPETIEPKKMEIFIKRTLNKD